MAARVCGVMSTGIGIRFAYTGNIHDGNTQSTYCPQCGALLIQRDWYELGEYRLNGNRCGYCATVIPGLFEGQPGHWGRKRVPVRIQGQPL